MGQRISLLEYAKNCNISYEAVRKSVALYREKLGDHITKDHRKYMLDEYAVSFLNEHREPQASSKNKQKELDEVMDAYRQNASSWDNERKILYEQINHLKEEQEQWKKERITLLQQLDEMKTWNEDLMKELRESGDDDYDKFRREFINRHKKTKTRFGF